MTKASPIKRSFNAGEFSPMVEGRTDLDRYNSSCRELTNYVAAPQGPAIPRSGTALVAAAYKPDERSELIPFVFDDSATAEDAQVIEFANQRIRIHDEAGLLVEAPVAATITTTAPFVVNAPGLGAVVGDQLVLLAFPDNYNLNAVQANIMVKVGNDYTIDLVWPGAEPDPGAVQVARVFHLASPYNEEQAESLRPTQSLDVLYLTNLRNKPYKLSRNNTYDWEFEAINFSDGPYLDRNKTTTTLTPDVNGKATPDMTSNTLPTGTCFASTEGTPAWHAFNLGSVDDFWRPTTDQKGTIGYQFPAGQGQIVNGYSIHMGNRNTSVTYTSKNYAPSTFQLEGSNDGVNYDVIDRQLNYVAYDNNKTAFFDVVNETSYEYYRVVISSTTRNGEVEPSIKSLVLRSTTSTSLVLTASSVTGINGGLGFAPTDVDRLVRLKGSDGSWRACVITAVNSTTEVDVTLQGEPLPDLEAIKDWRLGYWSDTTGYPNTMTFYQDRTWWGGSDVAPDLIVASVTGDYENMQPSTPEGEVLDTNSLVFRLNSRKLSRVKWIAESNKGLLAGTGSQEYVISSTEGARKKVTTETVQALRSTQRGSTNTEPVVIDDQVLYVQRSGRNIREYAYVFDSDNFKSPSMTLLANHIGASPFVQMEYAAEPYSIVWCRRADGSLVGLTYNRDENVIGWHQHDISGATIESMAVIPAEDQLQDVLFLFVKRVIDGQTVRFIERLTRFWDFDMELEDAHYVDSALKYSGVPISTMYGLQHLEGEEVYGLADGVPIGPHTVENGAVEIPLEASAVILGLGFEARGETARLDNGAEDGTAIGKEKRINKWSVLVWRSFGGELGVWNEDRKEINWSPVEYEEGLDEIETISLDDDEQKVSPPEQGYNKRGTIFFRRKKEEPLPFNIVALMPQLNTQDGG